MSELLSEKVTLPHFHSLVHSINKCATYILNALMARNEFALCAERLHERQRNLWLSEEEVNLGIVHLFPLPPDIAFIHSDNFNIVRAAWNRGEFELDTRKRKRTNHSLFDNLGIKDKDQVKGAKLILLTLFAHAHFSLLVYYRDRKQCYHYDTIRGFHASLAEHAASLLLEWDIVEEYGHVYHPYWLPTQQSTWECGYAVIILACVMFAKGRPISPKDVRTRFPEMVLGNTCMHLRRDLYAFFKEKSISMAFIHDGEQQTSCLSTLATSPVLPLESPPLTPYLDFLMTTQRTTEVQEPVSQEEEGNLADRTT